MSDFVNDAALDPVNADSPASPGPDTERPTPLADALGSNPQRLARYRGAETLEVFSTRDEELHALLHTAGIFDLGYRARIEVRGEDRSRWLNGMLTNNIQTLGVGEGNYNFVLNAQGRIQGDCDAFRRDDRLLLETDRIQAPALVAHLDHFIIMDDVDLRDVSADWTAIGIAGPQAAATLARAGVELPAMNDQRLGIVTASIAVIGPEIGPGTGPGIRVEIPMEVVVGHSGAAPRFELWFAPQHVLSIWKLLQSVGAEPCGSMAVEALRILNAVPLYGVDLLERDLPQEANQPQALNFSKGCYLGQEIVERIRSRGNVHRKLVQFTLSSMPATLPAELSAGGQPAGRITSATDWNGSVYALGMARVEALERGVALEYKEGTATLLTESPVSGLQVSGSRA